MRCDGDAFGTWWCECDGELGIALCPAPSRPSHDDVALLARRLWEERGRPDGQDLALWFEAEARLEAGRG